MAEYPNCNLPHADAVLKLGNEEDTPLAGSTVVTVVVKVVRPLAPELVSTVVFVTVVDETAADTLALPDLLPLALEDPEDAADDEGSEADTGGGVSEA